MRSCKLWCLPSWLSPHDFKTAASSDSVVPSIRLNMCSLLSVVLCARFVHLNVPCAHFVCGCSPHAMHSRLSTLRWCCCGIVVWLPTLQPTRWHLIVAASAPCSVKAAGRGFRAVFRAALPASGRHCVFALTVCSPEIHAQIFKLHTEAF